MGEKAKTTLNNGSMIYRTNFLQLGRIFAKCYVVALSLAWRNIHFARRIQHTHTQTRVAYTPG